MRRYYSYPYQAEPLRFPVEPIARKFVAVAIFVCLFLVFFNLAAHAALDPKKMAENDIVLCQILCKRNIMKLYPIYDKILLSFNVR